MLTKANKHSELAKKSTIFLASIYMEHNAIRTSSLPNSLPISGAFNAKKFVSEHRKFRILATNSIGSR